MNFYIICHKPTGRTLPARVQSTKWDFSTPDGPYEPRLFRTHRAAMNCATLWSQGTWEKDVRTESDGWEYPKYMVEDPPTPTAVPGRLREHLEVIPAMLVLNPAGPSPAIWVEHGYFKKEPA